MNRNYLSLEINSVNMKQIDYLHEIKKLAVYFLLKFVTLIKKKGTIFFKICLLYFLKIIKFTLPYKLAKRLIPNIIKIKIKVLLFKYPNLTKIIKNILAWVKSDEKIKSNLLINFFIFIFKIIFMPILRTLLNNLETQTIIYNELRRRRNFRVDSNKIIKDKNTNNIHTHQLLNKKFLIYEDLNLSLDTNEIYHKFKLTFIEYHTQP